MQIPLHIRMSNIETTEQRLKSTCPPCLWSCHLKGCSQQTGEWKQVITHLLSYFNYTFYAYISLYTLTWHKDPLINNIYIYISHLCFQSEVSVLSCWAVSLWCKTNIFLNSPSSQLNRQWNYYIISASKREMGINRQRMGIYRSDIGDGTVDQHLPKECSNQWIYLFLC